MTTKQTVLFHPKKTEVEKVKGIDKISLTYFPIEVFNSTVVLCYSNEFNVDEITNKLCEHYDFKIGSFEDDSGDTSALTLTDSPGRTVYLIFDKDTDLGFIHHEVIHAAKAVLNLIQTGVTRDTEEVYAYLSQYLFTNCYNKLKTFKSCKHCTDVTYIGTY